jgi:molybdopterin synthase catalytic subunit
VVVFEGTVRDTHEDRGVVALEYEAADALATRTFAAIEQEAIHRFGLEAVSVVHRIGRVPAGEPGVWVGVASAHREAGFDGCRYIIDELKQRLPIWKKECFADGTHRWVNAP